MAPHFKYELGPPREETKEKKSDVQTTRCWEVRRNKLYIVGKNKIEIHENKPGV